MLATVFAALAASSFPDCGEFPAPVVGSYGPTREFNATWEGKPLFVVMPTAAPPDGAKGFPLMVSGAGVQPAPLAAPEPRVEAPTR